MRKIRPHEFGDLSSSGLANGGENSEPIKNDGILYGLLRLHYRTRRRERPALISVDLDRYELHLYPIKFIIQRDETCIGPMRLCNMFPAN